jgi:tripartite-type tricarboxylate transporter receptor subunit TctC
MSAASSASSATLEHDDAADDEDLRGILRSLRGMLALRLSRNGSPMRRFLLLQLLAAVSALPLVASGADAPSWPTRPVRMIVPEAAGGTQDAAARAISGRLAQMLGQPVLVENRAGDGAQAAARAAPDGYTYLFAPAPLLVANQYIMKLVPYSAEDDFAGVAMVGTSPLALAVNPALNVDTLAGLIALAKARPGRLAFTSPGRRTLPGLLGELFRIRAGVNLQHVPTKGAQGLSDTIAGRAQVTVQDIAAIAGALQRNEVRALAVGTASRLPDLGDVPTFGETLPGFELNGWFAVVAPSGTPSEAIQRMNLELYTLLADADIAQRLRALGIYPEGPATPDQVNVFFAKERSLWDRLARELKIEPE